MSSPYNQKHSSAVSAAARKTRLPVLPKLELHETSIDVSLLDVMALEDFLSMLKGKTDANWKELWKETCIFTKQLKASRELLSIGSNLISNRASRKIIDRLLDVTHTLLNAERVIVMELDSTGNELFVTHSKDEKAIGLRVSPISGIECKFLSAKTSILFV
jgi:hypothetical protein